MTYEKKQNLSKDNIKQSLDVRQFIQENYPLRKVRIHAHKITSCCPFHEDKTPSLYATKTHYSCSGCGASGDIFTLIQNTYDCSFEDAIQHGANLAGITPESLESREDFERQKAKRDYKRKREEHQKQKEEKQTLKLRRDVHKRLWKIVQPLKLTQDAKQWLISRSIQPEVAYQLGCRDWSLAAQDLEHFYQSLSPQELKAAGLVNDKKNYWKPWKKQFTTSSKTEVGSLVFPVWMEDGIPTSFRQRHYKSVGKHELKVSAQYKSYDGLTYKKTTYLHGNFNAKKVIIVEGEPDYLTTCQLLTNQNDIAVIGLSSTHSHHVFDCLNHFKSLQSITLATHHDRKKNNTSHEYTSTLKKPYAQNTLVLRLKHWAKEHPNVAIQVFDIPGHNDLNDQLQSNKLSWFVKTIIQSHTHDYDVTMHCHIETQSKTSPRVDLKTGQTHLGNQIKQAIKNGGKYALKVDAGTGKTHQTILAALELWKTITSRVNQKGKIAFVTATNKLAEELEQKIKQLAEHHLNITEQAQLDIELVLAPKRTKDTCFNFEAVKTAHKVSQDAVKKVCQSCQHYQNNSCPFRESLKTHQRSRIVIMTHHLAQSYLNKSDYELVVIDEDIMSCLYPTHELDLNKVAKLLHGSIDITPEHFKTFALSMGQGEYGSEQLNQILPHENLQVISQKPLKHLIEVATQKTGQAQIQALNKLPSQKALSVLQKRAKDNWKGCYVKDSKLVVWSDEHLQLERHKTVLYLDATTTPIHAQAVLGENYKLIDIKIKTPECVTYERIDFKMSKNMVSHRDFKVGRPYLKTTQAIINKYEKADTAYILHKNYRENATLKNLLSEAEKDDRILHHGAARGINALESCNTVIVAAYHVPKIVKQARSELLQSVTKKDVMACQQESEYALELAPMIQAIHRIRPVRAHENTQLVVIDSSNRLDTLFDEYPIKITSQDTLKLEMFGDVSSTILDKILHDFIYHEVFTSKLALTRIFKGSLTISPNMSNIIKDNLGLYVRQPKNNVLDTMIEHVFERLKTRVKNKYKNSVELIASSCGLNVGFIKTSSKGKSLAYLYDEKHIPTLQHIKIALEKLDVSWFEYKDQKVQLKENKLICALEQCLCLEDVTKENLMYLLGISNATYYRELKQSGLTLENLKDLWITRQKEQPEHVQCDKRCSETSKDERKHLPVVTKRYLNREKNKPTLFGTMSLANISEFYSIAQQISKFSSFDVFPKYSWLNINTQSNLNLYRSIFPLLRHQST